MKASETAGMDYRIFVEPQEGASYEDQLNVALAAESLGFDGFFRSDHYLAMSGDGLPGPSDAWTTLAGLARETTRIKLGTMVSSMTFRHPGILAIQVAQVDQMSGGRAELGLGAGWFEREHSAYGIPFPEKRFGQWEEQLQIVSGLWATRAGSTFSFEGEHYTLVEAPALPKPVQRPMPLIVGGSGPVKTPRLAATYATEYNVGFGTLADMLVRLQRVRRECERIGRNPEELILSAPGTTAVGATDGAARQRAQSANADLDELRLRGFAGTAAEVVDKIGSIREMGFSRVYFQVMDMHDIDQLEFLASDVLPQLA
jgi:F420-dependent oxidoreductase-like protein